MLRFIWTPCQCQLCDWCDNPALRSTSTSLETLEMFYLTSPFNCHVSVFFFSFALCCCCNSAHFSSVGLIEPFPFCAKAKTEIIAFCFPTSSLALSHILSSSVRGWNRLHSSQWRLSPVRAAQIGGICLRVTQMCQPAFRCRNFL